MSASIELNSPHNHITNLDVITGRVVVNLPSEAAIGGIQVKLEGESKTRLTGPRHPNGDPDKKRTELEVHKILYKVVTVFPTPAIFNPESPNTTFTFAAGSYEYPFEFKVPFNNACSTHNNSMLTNLNITGLKVEMARESNRHVKKTLPPSLNGFPGMADIKYYIKATIIRPQFYKENIRAITPLNFLPIEPPRTGNPSQETYARRQHQFTKQGSSSKTKSLFQKVSGSFDPFADGPRVSADARLPNPSILTCNEPIPLRVLVKKISDNSETIFLQSFQIELIARTHILAHDLNRTETGSWVILSRTNMGVALGKGSDPAGTEWTIDARMWNQLPLPNSVAPNFETCNVSRTYELEVRVGLSYGSFGNIKPQLIILPLKMPVKIYSGIAPPKALLDAMTESGRMQEPTAPSLPARPTDGLTERPPMPPRPAAAPEPTSADQVPDEAPPSYEDAMAETLSPVDGPRREYNPPDDSSRTIESGADSKPPVNPGRDPDTSTSAIPYGNPAAISSEESFDMLPSTPPETHSGSPPTSPVARQQSVLKIHKVPPQPEEDPPEYRSIAGRSPQSQESPQEQRQSRQGFRPINLGVPSRKPVPRSPHPRG
ncbi:arrestin (or S-antigen), N-terminal domain protein [Aspergillus ruber CBS 135680]|uniref:Or S-antigen, N-terminal domain protein n=1 Tax=Aspergillus ruber (strain CBS 135680) TaxID=1388766 RepID=A0A017SE78_ASPRC|nr:or S-antigen, N-terminal domain protein [Aspergillus ruber CBS 135680]EYE94944.1 or S-antigen, N-terminal domain protein [Aspergillus ruber CBS 135680]